MLCLSDPSACLREAGRQALCGKMLETTFEFKEEQRRFRNRLWGTELLQDL